MKIVYIYISGQIVKNIKHKIMAKQSYRFKFEIIGNSDSDSKVSKANSKFGDGEIGTGSGGYLKAAVSANIKLVDGNKRVKLMLTYSVAEDDFGKKKNDDKLFMSKTFYYDVSSFTQLQSSSRISGGNRITTTIESIKLLTPNGNTPSAAEYSAKISTDDEKHKELAPTWTGNTQSWLPTDQICIKVDGKGKELEKEGNLSIRGYVYIDIERVEKEITEEIYQDEPDIPKLDYGVGRVLETLPETMQRTLGCGYDIAGDAPQLSSCKYSVLDLDRLNKYKHLLVDNAYKSDNKAYDGESLREYTEDINTKYGISVSGSVFGVTFSNETSWSFSEKKNKKTISKYQKKDFKSIYHVYRIDDIVNPQKLLFFLTEKFKKDLNELNPEEFVERYGTHVVLGMMTGGRLTYNMRHDETLLSGSTATTIDSTTKVGYDSSKAPKDNGGDANVSAALNNLYAKMGDPNVSMKDLSELAKTASTLQGVLTNTQKPSSSGGDWSVSAGFTYNNAETMTFSNSDKTVQVTCYSVGGDPAMAGCFLTDETKYEKWAATVKDNQVFMDFVTGAVIPIEEFIPKSRRGEEYKLTKEMVKEAVESHLMDKRLQTDEPESGEQTLDFNTQGKLNSVMKQEDEEVDSKSDKQTGWDTYFELVNFGDGFVGCSIKYSVHEGGLNAGKTILENNQEVKLVKGKFSQMVINNESTTYHAQGTVKGEHHEWIDVTEFFQDCEFLDTFGSNVEIKVDGKGNDLGNIGIKGRLKINYKAL